MNNPDLDHVYFDISWDKVANYAVESEEASRRVAGVINRHPERILFGTDCVSPANTEAMLKVFRLYAPVWKLLTPEASHLVRFGNHERIFDEATRRTREWERANVPAWGAEAADRQSVAAKPHAHRSSTGTFGTPRSRPEGGRLACAALA